MWLPRLLILAVVIGGGCERRSRRVPPLAAAAKACAGRGDLGCPRAILYVHDLAASQRYYRDQLGFKLDWADGDPATFAAVSRGDTQIFLCEQCQGHPGTWQWVFTPDVDRLHRELIQRHARIQEPPDDKPWDVREMQVADLDGNVLRIGSPIDHD